MSPEIVNGLFAIGGALIGVAGAWLVSRASREKRRLTLFVSPVARLLDVADLVRSDVKVLYKDAPAEALGAGEVAIQNTGSVAIEGIEVSVKPSHDSPIVDLEVKSANFAHDDEFVTRAESGLSQIVSVKFLNPNDRLVLEYRVLGALSLPEVSARLKDVDVQLKKEMVSWLPDIYAEVVAAAFSQLPGFKFAMRFSRPFRLYLESKRENF